MNERVFRQKLGDGRAEWEAFLATIPAERMEMPGLAEGWTIKDVIAHVTWFEREMVQVIEARALVGSGLWLLPTDERNRAIYEQNHERPLANVLAEAKSIGTQLLTLAQTLSEEELNQADRFKEMPTEWIPWQLIADNSFTHYPDHIADIEAWLQADA